MGMLSQNHFHFSFLYFEAFGNDYFVACEPHNVRGSTRPQSLEDISASIVCWCDYCSWFLICF